MCKKVFKAIKKTITGGGSAPSQGRKPAVAAGDTARRALGQGGEKARLDETDGKLGAARTRRRNLT